MAARCGERDMSHVESHVESYVEELRVALRSGRKKELAQIEMSALSLAYALGYREKRSGGNLPDRRT